MGQTNKKIYGKVLAKHETEAIWDYSNEGAGVNYIPDKGEQVIYDPDDSHQLPRVKYGNGVDIVKNLPFATVFEEGAGKNSAQLPGAHAEGENSVAFGQATAKGRNAIAEGAHTKALHNNSHAEGEFTQTSRENQHVEGQYNLDYANALHIVGNGTDADHRSNAHTIDKDGNGWFAGSVKIGGTSQDDENAKTLATTEDITDAVNTFIGAYITSDGGAIDKLQEIADWIDSDKNGSADIIAQVEANTKAISDHETNAAKTYETKTDAANKLAEAKAYTDSRKGIVDVIELPTSNINTNVTYRLLNGIFMRGGLKRNDYNCYIVEWDSPSGNGEPVIKYVDGEMVVSGYYNNKNNTVYGYVDSVTKTALTEKIDQMVAEGSLNSVVAAGLKLAIGTMSTGWKTMDAIFSNAVVSQLASWGGIITAPEQATNEDAAYVLLYDEFYSYKHNTWIGVDLHIGMSGDGPGAEKFNDINNIASGARSHAEGHLTAAIGGNTHVEGYATVAEGDASHAEGAGSKTYALAAHAEGRDSYANSEASHAEGEFTSATGVGSHTEGYNTRTNGKGAHHEGIRLDGSETVTKNNIEYTYGANTDASHAEGINTVAGGALEHKAAHAEGADTIAAGWSAHAEGLGSYAVGSAAHAEGRGTSANGEGAHAEGRDTVAQGIGAHVEGVRLPQYEPAKREDNTKEYKFGAFAQGAHAEGLNTGAHGEASHTEGSDTIVTAKGGHAEGLAAYVTGQGAHAEGRNTWAAANYAHAEGYATKAQGAQSHAAGSDTIAKGASSYAGGTNGSTTHLTGSFVHGKGVKDDRWYQAVFGLYNKHATTTNDKGEVVPVETSDYLVVGCGGADNERDNCFTAGKSSTDGKYITIGDTKLTEAKVNKLADKDYVDNAIQNAGGGGGGFECPVKSGTGANSVRMANATASGIDSMAEGTAIASEQYAHAEGQGSIASGVGSHAEGGPLVWDGSTHYTTASSAFSHAEGEGSMANAEGAHAEGLHTQAKARFAHTEGWDTIAEGTGAANNGAEAAHVEGYGTIAKVKAQHVEGRYNADEATALHITGCGTSSKRENCFTAGVDSGAKYIKIGEAKLTEAQLSSLLAILTQGVPTISYGDGSNLPTSGMKKGDIYIQI